MVLSNHNVLNHFAVHFSPPAEALLENCDPGARSYLESCLDAAWAAVRRVHSLPCSRQVAPLDEATSE